MVKKEFRIVGLEAAPNESILLLIVPVYSLQQSSQEEVHPSLDPEKVIVGPAIESEDAKVARGVMKAMMNEVNKCFQQLASPPPTSFAPRGLIPIQLSKQEYEELGKPVPHEIITLTFTLERGETHEQ